MTHREIATELETIPNMMRRTVCGISVLRVGNDFRATLPNGTLSGWWRSNVMATILDSWSRPTTTTNPNR
jgi:hypothetical protein